MLSPYGKREWLTIMAMAAVLVAVAIFLHWWWLLVISVLAAATLLSFFRDPRRTVPTLKGVMVSPADGRISAIHHLDHYEPLKGPATCIRVLLYVTDVHVNRSPCHGAVESITYKTGYFINVLNPKSAENNESNTIVLVHPVRRTPVAAIKQIAGQIARRIVCGVEVGDTLQRGQRIGMIKFGSTTELYIPDTLSPEIVARQGQYVYGGYTVLAKVHASTAHEIDINNK